MTRPSLRTVSVSTLAVAALVAPLSVVLSLPSTPAALATVEPGTPGKDVHIGLDDDDADNVLVQPPGVVAAQHMADTDLLFGRGDDDLLVGRRGSDTLLGGDGDDILVGGPDHGSVPSSDVSVGDTGNDIALWGPGDGNDAFDGNEGYDTMVLAPLRTHADGSLVTTRVHGRLVPRAHADGLPHDSCTLVRVPASSGLGFQYLVRFTVDGTPVATVRQKDVERVLCAAPGKGTVQVARLTAAHPRFRTVALSDVRGITGAVVAPLGTSS